MFSPHVWIRFNECVSGLSYDLAEPFCVDGVDVGPVLLNHYLFIKKKSKLATLWHLQLP